MEGNISDIKITSYRIIVFNDDHDYLKIMFGVYDGGYVITTDKYKYYSL